MIDWLSPNTYLVLVIILCIGFVAIGLLYVIIRWLICAVSETLYLLTDGVTRVIDEYDVDEFVGDIFAFLITLPFRPIAWLICHTQRAKHNQVNELQPIMSETPEELAARLKHEALVEKYYYQLGSAEEREAYEERKKAVSEVIPGSVGYHCKAKLVPPTDDKSLGEVNVKMEGCMFECDSSCPFWGSCGRRNWRWI